MGLNGPSIISIAPGGARGRTTSENCSKCWPGAGPYLPRPENLAGPYGWP